MSVLDNNQLTNKEAIENFIGSLSESTLYAAWYDAMDKGRRREGFAQVIAVADVLREALYTEAETYIEYMEEHDVV